MRVALRRLAVLAGSLMLAVPLGGCARARADTGVERASSKRTDLITRDEMHTQFWANAYDLVAAVRPQWLHERGPDSFGTPPAVQVHFNDVRVGDVAALRQMPVGELAYIEYLDASAATARWGLGYGRGAINLSTRPR